jgi:hypothetical protein
MERDLRYRILVNLVRTDRPRYWTWHCPHCQFPVTELVNDEVQSMTDFFDMRNTDKRLVGHRCGGRSPTGIGRCDFWYYFNLSDKPPKGVV